LTPSIAYGSSGKVISVALLCQELVTGGAQRQLIQLAIGLHSAGIPVRVITFYDGGELLGELVHSGVEHLSLAKRGRWDVLGFGWRLLRTLRGLRPSVVYGYMAVADLLLVLAKPFLRNAAIVWGVRASNMNLERYDWLTTLAHQFESALSPYADLIIANSQSGASYVVSRGFPVDKIRIIPNGIDTDRFQFDSAGRDRVRREWKIDASEVLVGLPARLDPMKDHPSFLEAAAAAKLRNPLLKFVCVGDGEARYREELRRLADALQLTFCMVWAGARDDMAAVYSALDIAVSASAFGEGFSNAIGEAMACGRPCIVTDVGDSARIVDKSGIVVPSAAPEQLADAILTLARSDRDRLGKLSRDRAVALFSVSTMVASTLEALIDVAARRSAKDAREGKPKGFG